MTTDTMIVSTFDDKTIAGKAMKALRDEGFREGDIKILQGGTDALVSELVKRGLDEDEARRLADAAEQGKTLLEFGARDSSVSFQPLATRRDGAKGLRGGQLPNRAASPGA